MGGTPVRFSLGGSDSQIVAALRLRTGDASPIVAKSASRTSRYGDRRGSGACRHQTYVWSATAGAGSRRRRGLDGCQPAGGRRRLVPAAGPRARAAVTVPVLAGRAGAAASRVRSPGRPASPPGPCRRASAALRRRRAVAVGLLAVVMLAPWIGLQAALGRIGGGPLATTGAPGGVRAGGQPGLGRPARGHPLVDRRGGRPRWRCPPARRPAGAEAGARAIYPGETIAIPGR